MHFLNNQYKNRTTKGGGVLLLKKIKIKPLPLEITIYDQLFNSVVLLDKEMTLTLIIQEGGK